MADDKTEDTEKDVKSGEKSDPWERMGGMIRQIVGEELGKWQPSQDSVKSEETDEKSEEKKTERKKGFLENFFQGLD